MPDTNLSSQIDAIMSKYVKADAPGAAVAVIKHGRVAHRKGYGLANVEWSIPVKPDTVFRLASITKQFTAVAILMLQEQGKLNVEDSLSKYLPDYPTSGHVVTIHHMLTHTSGIKSYTSLPDFMELVKTERTPAQVMDLVKEKPFDFAPGAQFSYNNSGYILLGMIIEKVSGLTYADFLQQHIFTPLKMNQSYFLHNEPVIPKRASGYQQSEQGFVNAPYLHMSTPYAAGSLGSTVNDLALWDRAIQRNQLISGRTRAKMWKPVKLNDGSTHPYGYGWGVGEYREHRAISHSGGIHGFNTYMMHYPDDNAMVVLLCNHGTTTEKIVLEISRRLLDLPDVQRTPIALTDSIVAKVTGRYMINTYAVEVLKTEDKLIMKLGSDIHLLPLTESTFYDASDPEFVYEFSDEQDGKYALLTANGPSGGQFTLNRAPEVSI